MIRWRRCSALGTDAGHFAGRGAGDRVDESGYEGAQVLNTIRAGVRHDDG